MYPTSLLVCVPPVPRLESSSCFSPCHAPSPHTTPVVIPTSGVLWLGRGESGSKEEAKGRGERERMGKAKKSRAVRVKFAQTKRLLSPKDCRLKGNQEKEETKRKKVREWCVVNEGWLVFTPGPIRGIVCTRQLFYTQHYQCRVSISMSSWGPFNYSAHTRDTTRTAAYVGAYMLSRIYCSWFL